MSDLSTSGLDSLKRQCEEQADFFRVLANPTRLLLLCHIAKGECSVAEMERELGLRQPGLSQQLGELRQKGLLQTRRESRSVFYALSDPRFLSILNALHLNDIGANQPKGQTMAQQRESKTSQIGSGTSLGERAKFARVTRALT